MDDQGPWWVEYAINAGVSALLFAVGYFVVYRTQIRHLKAQIQDRSAALAAAQAREAIALAKATLKWYPRATASYDRPFAGEPLPTPDEVDDSRRLANDPDLARLLEHMGRLIGELPELGSRSNVLLSLNRDAQAVARLGPTGLFAPLTPGQLEYLRPSLDEWKRRREEWGLVAEELNRTAERLRARGEELLRAVQHSGD